MKTFTFILILISMIFGFSLTVFAQNVNVAPSEAVEEILNTQPRDSEAKLIIQNVLEEYNSYKSLKINCLLKVEHSNFSSIDTINGISQGNKYRISTKINEIVCEGDKVWFFDKVSKKIRSADPDPSEVNLVYPHIMLDLYSKRYHTSFSGERQLNDHTISRLEFTPKDDKDIFEKIQVYVDKDSWQILRVNRFAKDGTKYTVDFKETLSNLKIDPLTFKFRMS